MLCSAVYGRMIQHVLDAMLYHPPDPQIRPRVLTNGAVDVRDVCACSIRRYNIELSDLQILVGRARDSWQYAHTKSTSSLHLLDRFSISLQVCTIIYFTKVVIDYRSLTLAKCSSVLPQNICIFSPCQISFKLDPPFNRQKVADMVIFEFIILIRICEVWVISEYIWSCSKQH